MTFHLSLFGIPELTNPSGSVVHLRTRKQLALLAYLALEARARPVSRDRLVELLWTGVAQEKARHSLSQGLTALRKAFGHDIVRKSGESVSLVAPLTTDLDLPEWNGADLARPLYELDRCAGADFAHWVDSVRQRCVEAVRTNLAKAIERARLDGDIAAVHERASTLYSVDPLSDIAAQALAERSLLQGDAAAAMRLLRDHLRRADEEMGGVPHAELKRLVRRIEAGSHTSAATRVDAPAEAPTTREEIFVGRESELGQMEALWASARRGSLQTCLLTGPAGIGKTSLLRRFVTTVTARGYPSVLVTCQEIGAGIPFAVVADLMRELARDPALGGTDPMWLAEATRVYPALKRTYPGVPEPPSAPADAIKLRLAEALYRMLESISDEGPIALAFDDVQHMDPASREVVHLLVRQLDARSALIVGTWRTSAADRAATASGPIQWGTLLDVRPLDNGDVLSVIASTPGGREIDRRIRDEIVRLSSGNPYFAQMLLADWERHASVSLAATELAGDATVSLWRPPQTMRIAFARQLEGMMPEDRDLLDSFVVAGRAMSTAEMSALLRWTEARVDRAVVALMERGIVRFEVGAIEFKNELHRAFVYYAMQEETRKYHHSRIAAFVLNSAPAEHFLTSFEASHHLVRAGMLAEAVGAVQKGAEVAIARGAPREAEKALRSVIGAGGSTIEPRLHLLLARALHAQGKYQEGLEIISRFSPGTGRQADLAEAALLRARALRGGRLADGPSIEAAARSAVANARLSKNARLTVEALQVQAEVAAESGDHRTLRWAARASRRVGERAIETDTKALAELTRAFSLMVGGELAPAKAAFLASSKLLESMSLDTDQRRSLNGLGMCCTGLGLWDEAIEAFERAIRISQRTRDSVFTSVLCSNLSAVYGVTGRHALAAESMGTAIRLCEAGSERAKAWLYSRAGSLAMELEDRTQAAAFIEAAEKTARSAGIWIYEVGALIPKAELLILDGQNEHAWCVVQEAVERTRGRVCPPAELTGLERLRRHWIFATRGYGALQEAASAENLPRFHVMDRLQIQALHEWAAEECGEKMEEAKSVTVELQSRGLHGEIAKLVALGIYPGRFATLKSGESIAQLVERLFPDSARKAAPQAVPVD